MRILIADDDPQFLRALRITLGARGYEVLLARDGQHALEMAIDHKPDIILLDLGMPRLDGVKVIDARLVVGADPGDLGTIRVGREGGSP